MAEKQPCPVCGKLARLTRHHVLPKHVFGENDSAFYLCRNCHDGLELAIRDMERTLLKECDLHYARTVERFLQETKKRNARRRAS